MPIRYFKRFRMEIDLPGPPVPALPTGYRLLAWDDALLDAHASVKFACFHDELDSLVFPSLGDPLGCRHLMQAIRGRVGFHPGATWLIDGPTGPCGTIQGLRQRGGWGAIQNLGVAPGHRGRGLGEVLLLRALMGFWQSGLGRAFLEVTASNHAAVRLYRRAGFRCRKTLYKAVELADAFSTP